MINALLFTSLASIFCLSACQPAVVQFSLETQFENSLIVTENFSAAQKQRGNIKIGIDPVDTSNRVAVFTAGAKKNGKVGKADLIYRFPQIGAGKTVRMTGRFYFPSKTKLNSIILMDLECAKCGPDTNPGIRLYLRNGTVRIDRSKIGIKAPFIPKTSMKLETKKWYEITWIVFLSEFSNGHSIVKIDNNIVLDQSGTTLLSQNIVRTLTSRQVISAVDRFQIGLTANSNSSEVKVLVDDVGFSIN